MLRHGALWSVDIQDAPVIGHYYIYATNQSSYWDGHKSLSV